MTFPVLITELTCQVDSQTLALIKHLTPSFPWLKSSRKTPFTTFPCLWSLQCGIWDLYNQAPAHRCHLPLCSASATLSFGGELCAHCAAHTSGTWQVLLPLVWRAFPPLLFYWWVCSLQQANLPIQPLRQCHFPECMWYMLCCVYWLTCLSLSRFWALGQKQMSLSPLGVPNTYFICGLIGGRWTENLLKNGCNAVMSILMVLVTVITW